MSSRGEAVETILFNPIHEENLKTSLYVFATLQLSLGLAPTKNSDAKNTKNRLPEKTNKTLSVVNFPARYNAAKNPILKTLDREIKIAAAFQSLLDSIEKIWKSRSKLAINPRAVNTISR